MHCLLIQGMSCYGMKNMSFAKQSKYVDARYYERALTISPNHILSLRRLCEILGPDGLDDTIGLKTVYNIMKKHEQQLFEGAAKFYAANDFSIQPFQCVLDGGGIRRIIIIIHLLMLLKKVFKKIKIYYCHQIHGFKTNN